MSRTDFVYGLVLALWPSGFADFASNLRAGVKLAGTVRYHTRISAREPHSRRKRTHMYLAATVHPWKGVQETDWVEDREQMDVPRCLVFCLAVST